MVNFFDNSYQEAAFFASAVVGIFSYYVMVLIINKYHEKKSNIVRTLAFCIFFLASAVIIDPATFVIFRAFGLTGAPWNYATGIQTTASFGLAGIANAFLVGFLVKVFREGKYTWYSYIIIVLELVVLPWGLYLSIVGQDTLPVLALLLAASLVLYIIQIVVASRLEGRIDKSQDYVSFKGIQYIGVSGMFLIATFAAFVLQEVAKQVSIFASIGLMEGSDSIFVPLGWVFAGITTYLLYVGYIMPEWVKKRWTRQATKSKRLKKTMP
jgi:hypothetical protein